MYRSAMSGFTARLMKHPGQLLPALLQLPMQADQIAQPIVEDGHHTQLLSQSISPSFFALSPLAVFVWCIDLGRIEQMHYFLLFLDPGAS